MCSPWILINLWTQKSRDREPGLVNTTIAEHESWGETVGGVCCVCVKLESVFCTLRSPSTIRSNPKNQLEVAPEYFPWSPGAHMSITTKMSHP